MPRPIEGSFQPYTSVYISKVKEDNVADAFKNQHQLITDFFENIPESKATYAYAPGKWTLKELLQHMIDTERIFAYRAVCIARKETQNLPGFDENEYVQNSHANTRNWKSLLEELKLVRQSTEILFSSFSEETLQQTGIANNNSIALNTIVFIAVGHIYHHVEIIKERYLLEGNNG